MAGIEGMPLYGGIVSVETYFEACWTFVEGRWLASIAMVTPAWSARSKVFLPWQAGMTLIASPTIDYSAKPLRLAC